MSSVLLLLMNVCGVSLGQAYVVVVCSSVAYIAYTRLSNSVSSQRALRSKHSAIEIAFPSVRPSVTHVSYARTADFDVKCKFYYARMCAQ